MVIGGPLVGGGRPRTGGSGPDRTAATAPTVLSSPHRRGCARSLAPGSAALTAHPRTVNLREDVVTARINQWIGSLFAPHNHVFYRKGESTFSCYRFDKVAILTPIYAQQKAETLRAAQASSGDFLSASRVAFVEASV